MAQNDDGSDALNYVQGGSRGILVKVPNDTAMHSFQQPDSCSDEADFHAKIFAHVPAFWEAYHASCDETGWK